MTKKYEIVLKYIQDLSVEVPNPEIFIYSREKITRYSLGINITTKTLKNGMIEVITKLNYKDPSEDKRKSYFEISHSTVVKIKDKEINKKELEKILLCEVPSEIYPSIEKILIQLIKDSGFPELKLDKKIDFEQLYQQKLN
tara:strand:+ start:27 stop:449 length:423 start_codon:yes stop_codon:yes gene_type:complete